MGGPVQSYTAIVVSDEDFKAHIDGNELINEKTYLEWRQDHHECTFTPTAHWDFDNQMRGVIPSAYAH
jgi:hypothetical protein